MNNILKAIHRCAELTQQELADELKVSFATVNRWENGRTIPNRLAQSRLYDLCQQWQIPVHKMTLQKIADASKSLHLPSNRLMLYHGSKAGIVGTIAPVSRTRCDFGAGFYMGTEPMQPLALICSYNNSRFYIVSLNLEGLACLNVAFGLEWAMIIAFNRGKMEEIKGTKFYEHYRQLARENDIVIGNIALPCEDISGGAIPGGAIPGGAIPGGAIPGGTISSEVISSEVISGEIMYWMGYVYRYWHYYKRESSAKIYRLANFKTMQRNYLVLHTMDPELAIDDLLEMKKAKIILCPIDPTRSLP